MAVAISWDELRELAGFRTEKGCAISFFVDLDPGEVPTPPDVHTKVHSLLATAERDLDGRKSQLQRDQRETLKNDLERIRLWFDDGFDRQGARGVGVFAAGLDNFWATISVPDPVTDAVRIGSELYLAPLAKAASGDGGLMAFVGRERGQVWRLRGGELTEIADQSTEVQGQHSAGGWSQARYERSVENQVGQHLREVAETLDGYGRKLRGVPIVLFGNEEIRSEFEALVSHEVKSSIAGWVSLEAHADGAQVAEAARPVLAQWRARHDADILDRWREEAGRNARAASGWARTLEAASDGRVDLLLVQDGVDQAAFQCPQCGRAQLTDGSCPLDGTMMEAREDGLDLALHQTLAHGGTVHVIRDRDDLAPVGGVAAILRF